MGRASRFTPNDVCISHITIAIGANGPQFGAITINSQPSDGAAVSLGDGRVSYTPDSGFSGTDSFAYSIADNDGQVSQPATVTITVTPPDAGDVLNGGSGQDTVLASDGDDRIFGGSGDDELHGSFGDDRGRTATIR